MEERNLNPKQPGEGDSEIADLRHALAAEVARGEALLDQVRATEELLGQAREKVRALKHKRLEADHYRALLHELRSRWYLRPLIPRSRLQAPKADLANCWIYRGPHFDQPSPGRHRVLVVGHLLSTTLFGSEKSLLEIIAAIDPDRFDVFAVFPERNDQVFAALRSQVQGIAVFDYFWWRKDRPFHEGSVSIFEKICRERAIDLVHANTIMLSDPLLGARRAGIPAICNVRELISQDDELLVRLGGSASEIARIVCENATHLLANSAATLADYPCGENGSFLYNSVDAQAFDLPQDKDLRQIHVGLVSSNIRKKGVLDFLELARISEKELPTLQFHLIGPESALTREWRESGQKVPANFHLGGHVLDPPDAYRDLNVVLNLSRFAESFGRTVAEALAARRPVIGYRHGALPELIDEGETGFLVPYLDLGAVFDRLRFFAANPAKIAEFGERARARSLERFSRETFARDLEALYERLITEGRLER